VANADGSKVHRVTPWRLNAGDNSDWVPNGSRILVRSHVDDGEQSQYYTVRPDGSDIRQLTHFPTGTPVLSGSYSPDGRQIAFARGDAQGRADIWLMNADGTQAKPVLQQPPWDSAPDWGTGH
jgi:TolB protein